MNRKTPIAMLLALLLLTSIIPSSMAYKGYQLSRGEVSDFILIDQNGNNVTLHHSSGNILVVAFIFTRCPDVCPIITQSLKSVENGLSQEYSEHVRFMSISVDPEYDTTERLKAFSEMHQANWSHLTGDLETMKEVWKSFGIEVQKGVIEAHVAEENGYQSNDSTVIIVEGDSEATELMFLPTAWSLTNYASVEANWSLNYSTHQEYGRMVTKINTFESPSDMSWYWKIMTYNGSELSWEESNVGIDFIDALEHPNIAYLASNANESLLLSPDNQIPSLSIIYPDNTTEIQNITEFTEWHLTLGAMDGAGINFSSDNHSQFGHYFSSFNDESPTLDNNSWHWQLHTWNDTNMFWESSQGGVELLQDPQYIAWARNTTNDSEIPLPGAVQNMINEQENQVCNDHGWEMGSGSSKHCMCDEGYEWPEDTMLSCVEVEIEEEYSVGHSTITFILDSDRKPRVAWTGDNWDPEDFISDIEILAESEGLVDDSSDGVSGLTFVMVMVTFAVAAIAINMRSKPNQD